MVDQPHRGPFLARALVPAAVIALSLGLVLFFGVRAAREYRHLQESLPPGPSNVEPIRGWMTVPYIARAYDVPEAALFRALGIPRAGNERLSLRRLAAKYHRDPREVQRTIEAVILQVQRSVAPLPGARP